MSESSNAAEVSGVPEVAGTQDAADVRDVAETTGPSAEPATSDAATATDGQHGPGVATSPRRRGPRRAVRRGTEREAVLGVSADERPAGWGDGSESGARDAGHGSNDEQLRRDVPPHWG